MEFKSIKRNKRAFGYRRDGIAGIKGLLLGNQGFIGRENLDKSFLYRSGVIRPRVFFRKNGSFINRKNAVENLESIRAKPARQGIQANNANRIIWVKEV